MKRLNVAIAGCGWVADWHVRDGLAHIPQLFALTACCDTDATRLNAFAQRYGIATRSQTSPTCWRGRISTWW